MSWSVSREIQPGKYTIDDFNYHTPRDRMTGEGVPETPKDHDLADFEIYDYPGEYDLPGAAPSTRARGSKSCTRSTSSSPAAAMSGSPLRGRCSRCRITRSQYNAQYMLTSVSYTASVGEYASGGTGGDFHCGIAAIASGTAFRPPRITPKPIVQGPQTAIVVGKAGEEIYTDDEGLGRVKVQFHWDRYSQTDENSSCWCASPSRSRAAAGASSACRGPRGRRRVPRGRPGPSHRHGQRLQRRAQAPLRTAHREDPNRLQEPFVHGLLVELQRAAIRGQDRRGGHLHPRREGQDDPRQERPGEVDRQRGPSHHQAGRLREARGGPPHHADGRPQREARERYALARGGDPIQGKVANKLAYDVGTEIHLKSGDKIVLESSTKITLVVGSSHITWSRQRSRSTPRRSRSRAAA